MAIVEALDYRGALLHMLNFATVVEEKRVAFRGETRARSSKGNSIAVLQDQCSDGD
ncbi:MAG TPA: hypothetical protein VGQ46_20895 [Thermoanaerobaculia bacterium]|jgi:hypothetical protein|nr:hypothetical protein [Thermoanaerobaculia bacterium]